MLTAIFFRRSPGVMEQIRGDRPRIRMVLSCSVAGCSFIFDVRSGALKACRREDWIKGAQELAEFMLPTPHPRFPDLLKALGAARYPVAASVMQYLVTKGVTQWKAPMVEVKPDDVLHVCLTTASLVKIRP